MTKRLLIGIDPSDTKENPWYLLNEMIVELRDHLKCTYTDLEQRSRIAAEAMQEVAQAWNSGLLENMTLGLHTYLTKKGMVQGQGLVPAEEQP